MAVFLASEGWLLDDPQKSRGWHTALYYFAEHIRLVSRGIVNHKALYAHIGTKGYYINHENPTIRKKTAAVLSRMIHSSRYVEDLQESYSRNNEVFSEAARWLLVQLRECLDCGDELLYRYLVDSIVPDIERGLENERAGGRENLNSIRVRNELGVISSWGETASVEIANKFTSIVSSLLYLMAFGHVKESRMRELSDETPLYLEVNDRGSHACRTHCACIIKYVPGDRRTVSDVWVVDGSRSFSIGRYSDCDVVETNRFVSRLHCAIQWRGDQWFLRDMGSKHGTRILDENGNIVFDSGRCEDVGGYELRFGQCLVLAGSSFYWFGAVDEVECGLVASIRACASLEGVSTVPFEFVGETNRK